MDESSPSRLAGMEELQSSNAVKAKGGAHGTTEDLHRPVSLLSLPDDLIYLVYSHFLDEAYADGRELCEPTPEACAVLVNKRIFKLCSPLLYRNLSLSDEDIELDYGLGQLAARIRALPLVRQLDTIVPFYNPNLFAAFLRLLPNLTSLTLRFDTTEDGSAAFPRALTSALSTLRQLQRLTIMDPPKLEDEAFSLTRDMPQLKHFNTPGSLFFSVCFPDGGGRLASLTLRTTSATTSDNLCFIPWRTLLYLRLEPQEGVLQKVHGWMMQATLDNLFNLHAFIFSFPRLEILILQGFHTRLGSLTTAASISRVNPTELLLRYPTIGALLISLRSTSVLELRYRAFGEKREMRWRRASRDDEFTSDCWTIG